VSGPASPTRVLERADFARRSRGESCPSGWWCAHAIAKARRAAGTTAPVPCTGCAAGRRGIPVVLSVRRGGDVQ